MNKFEKNVLATKCITVFLPGAQNGPNSIDSNFLREGPSVADSGFKKAPEVNDPWFER